jgi:DNA-binding CsgD family transcriptional regulator
MHTVPDIDSVQLNQEDLMQTLHLINGCLQCVDEQEFHNLLLSFADFLGFEFTLYGYTKSAYNKRRYAKVINLSNPEEWDAEYTQKQYLLHDPVMHETELRIKTGCDVTFIYWDAYEWQLSPQQQQVIDRRKNFGLHYGCSIFANSHKKDFAYLISFASRTRVPDARVEAIAKMIATHLLGTRKRLDMLMLVGSLSKKEQKVAQEMMQGKTNHIIANDLNITENTVKFHIKNIFDKLQVNNRLQASSVLHAERYLSV